jgi:hypothetical protein
MTPSFPMNKPNEPNEPKRKLPKLQPEGEPSVEQTGEVGKTGKTENGPRGRARLDSGELIPPKLKAKALAALDTCLDAVKWRKEGAEWTKDPDYATIIRAAELTLAYAEGRPVERKFELRGSVETFEDRKAAMLESPEGIRTLRAIGVVSEREAAEAMLKLLPAAQE